MSEAMRSQQSIQTPRSRVLSYFREAAFAAIGLLGIEMTIGCQEKDTDPFGLKKTEQVEINSPNCFEGCPQGSPETNKIISREVYTLSNNGRTKFADWVAYCVSKDTMTKKGGKKTEREWNADPELSDAETLEPDDYKDANKKIKTDRGHQAPIGSFQGTAFAHTTNYLSNITPQKSDLNQGPWNDLEELERELTSKYEQVFIVTGPLYEREMPSLPNADEEHVIPSAYWKVVIVRDTREAIKSAAFVMDQEKSKNSTFCTDQMSIDAVEARAKLDLFPNLPDDLEASLEAEDKGDLAVDLGCGKGKGKKKKQKNSSKKKSHSKTKRHAGPPPSNFQGRGQ